MEDNIDEMEEMENMLDAMPDVAEHQKHEVMMIVIGELQDYLESKYERMSTTDDQNDHDDQDDTDDEYNKHYEDKDCSEYNKDKDRFGGGEGCDVETVDKLEAENLDKACLETVDKLGVTGVSVESSDASWDWNPQAVCFVPAEVAVHETESPARLENNP